MFECSVCGLHFISGASCPSCGSTVAKDLEHGEELPSDDSHSMPGLDELADSIGDEPFEDETPQTIESTSTLPFGMGAESSVSASSLPFGIGSNVSELDDDQSSIPASILIEEGVAESQSSSEPEPEPEPASDDPELPVGLALSPATFFFLPVLKSVSYQPPPFRRNPAADTSLLSIGSLHIGQTFSGSSESF